MLALEAGGRRSSEAAQFVRLLTRCRARAVPRPLRPATIAAFTSRWSALLACSAARAFGASLLGFSLTGRPMLTATSRCSARSRRCTLIGLDSGLDIGPTDQTRSGQEKGSREKKETQ